MLRSRWQWDWEAAHNRNIVHRDIKPQNIIISTDGKVKVTDFGIARAASSNTISTNAMGSVHYSSPEQVRGGYSDYKSDIYSLGVTMYEMVTGKVPLTIPLWRSPSSICRMK